MRRYETKRCFQGESPRAFVSELFTQNALNIHQNRVFSGCRGGMKSSYVCNGYLRGPSTFCHPEQCIPNWSRPQSSPAWLETPWAEFLGPTDPGGAPQVVFPCVLPCVPFGPVVGGGFRTPSCAFLNILEHLSPSFLLRRTLQHSQQLAVSLCFGPGIPRCFIPPATRGDSPGPLGGHPEVPPG